MSFLAVRSPEAPKITTTVGGAPRCLLKPCRNGCLSESAMEGGDFLASIGVGKGNGKQGALPCRFSLRVCPSDGIAVPTSMAAPSIASALRRSLLIKIISKPQPSREDVASVIELTASKVVEALQAQSMTLYMVEGNDIAFKQIYYSPSLWGDDKKKEAKFKEMETKLLQLKIPVSTGIVGKVIQTGEPVFFKNTESQAPMMTSMAKTTGFEVRSMLTVPLKTTITLGAIQTLNK